VKRTALVIAVTAVCLAPLAACTGGVSGNEPTQIEQVETDAAKPWAESERAREFAECTRDLQSTPRSDKPNWDINISECLDEAGGGSAQPGWSTVVDGADTEDSAVWSCDYAPTMNDDWHDDALCSNGLQKDRPVLLPDDSFVDREEIMRALNDYEDYLNSAG
jgi:hypothetical protein